MTKSKLDHALSIAKAGLEAIPVVGGVIASLLGDYMPTSTERNVQRGMALFEQRLRELQDRLAEAVEADEFSELFKSCYLIWLRTHSESKLRAAANILANAVLQDHDEGKLPYSELDHYTHALESLSNGALDVLGYLYGIMRANFEPRGGLPEHLPALAFTNIAPDLPAYEPSLLMGLLGELDRLNFVLRQEPPAIHREGYSDYMFTLTPLGVRFCAHVLSA